MSAVKEVEYFLIPVAPTSFFGTPWKASGKDDIKKKGLLPTGMCVLCRKLKDSEHNLVT